MHVVSQIKKKEGVKKNGERVHFSLEGGQDEDGWFKCGGSISLLSHRMNSRTRRQLPLT